MDVLKKLNAHVAAKRLLGSKLIRTYDGKELSGKIVETEAYHQSDPSAHSFIGKTKRNQSMFLEGGHAYVYISYGIHNCMNVVCGEEGIGEGVLLRAIEPIEGIETMKKLRGIDKDILLTNGPGKLTQALAVSREYDGHNLSEEPLRIELNKPIDEENIVTTERVGISKAKTEKLRFYIKGNKYVSQY